MSKHDEVFTRGGLPAICVKVRGNAFSEQVLAEFERDNDVSYMSAFRAWINKSPESARESAWEAACEDGWGALQLGAAMCLGKDAWVEQEGRSGGWCVVHGLPDVAGWDTAMHESWAQFCEDVERIVRNVPHDIVWHLYFDYFEPRMEAGSLSARGMCE